MAADFTLSRSWCFVVVGTGDFSIQPKRENLQMYDHEKEVRQVFGMNAECGVTKLFDNESWQHHVSLGIDAELGIYRARRTSRL